ncbi:tRNA (adenosine(37)-N6)-dimethylallyltransferase MiaA [Spirochaetia bacterium 38H-sp]|uniref:tRNA dimethylallyltransferase n=1 Tax=Rarispira pelagica TaxID=3141764 RepID=A0ABU9UB24_9SPIR
MKKNNKPIPVVVILGPTGVGKTSLLIDNLYDIAEIISADAYQVYKGLDIGTAKPSLSEQKKLKHHLIDILFPDEQYTVGNFVQLADDCAKEIAARGKIPIVAGGTAYYLRHFIYGLPETPTASPTVRERVKRFIEEHGAQLAWEKLFDIDRQAAEKIGKNDVYRISRALEVIEQTGKKLSSFGVCGERRSQYSFYVLGLMRPREELYQRINLRVDNMFVSGLAEEVEALAREGYTADSPALKAIGYREFFINKGAPLDFIKEEIKKNTRHFAKRQLTFFKRFGDVRWYHPENISVVSDIKDFAEHALTTYLS